MKIIAKTGFTLIELLVVITIIGILATGATTVYTSQIQKARDTTRITDLKALESGIEQYYQDDTQYPQGGASWVATSGLSVTDYLPTLAEDPKHNQTCNASRCGYIYAVWADSVGIERWAYEISTAFENEGNRLSKADDINDNWDDENRLELGSGNPDPSLDTSRDPSQPFAGDILDDQDGSAVIVIRKGSVRTR